MSEMVIGRHGSVSAPALSSWCRNIASISLVWKLLITGVLVGYIPNLIHLFYAFSSDDYIFSWMGERLAQGELPYVEHVDHTFPAVLLPYAFTAFLGQDPIFVRAFDWIWQLATGLLLFYLGVKNVGPLAGFLAMVAYGALYGVLSPPALGSREALLTFLYVSSILLCERDSNKNLNFFWIFCAGLLSAMIFLVRPTHGLWWGFVVGWLVWKYRCIMPAFLYAIGCVVPVVSLLAVYFVEGGLKHLFECVIVYNSSYAAVAQGDVPQWFLDQGLWLILLLAIVSFSLWRTVFKENFLLFVMWLISAMLGGLIQGRLCPNHVLPLKAAGAFCLASGAVIFGGWVVQYLARFARLMPLQCFWRTEIKEVARRLIYFTVRGRRYVSSSAVFVLMAVGGSVYLRFTHGQIPQYHSVISYFVGDKNFIARSFGWDQAVKFQTISEVVRGSSLPSDSILNLADPAIMYFAKRKSASRFFVARLMYPPDAYYPHPLSEKWDKAYVAMLHNPNGLWQRWQHEFAEAVISGKPKLIVIDPTQFLGLNRTVDALKEDFPNIWHMLQKNYVLTKTIGGCEIYERTVLPLIAQK